MIHRNRRGGTSPSGGDFWGQQWQRKLKVIERKQYYKGAGPPSSIFSDARRNIFSLLCRYYFLESSRSGLLIVTARPLITSL